MMRTLRKTLGGGMAKLLLCAAALLIIPAAILVGLIELICRFILLVT